MLARTWNAVLFRLNCIYSRERFSFFFFEGGALSSNYGFHFIWRPYYSCGSSALHLKTFTFTVNYHFAGFNGLTILSTAAKIQTTKLSILRRFYFYDVLEQLKTNFHKNFRFKRVLGFVIEYAWISKLLRDAAFTWQPRELSL